MKKVLAILLALAFAAFLLPGCPGGGGGGGGEELGVGLARAVDKQFGPVTEVNSDVPKEIAAGGGGSHEAIMLRGRVDKSVLSQVAGDYAMIYLPPSFGNVPTPAKSSALESKLDALAGAAGSVDSNPCEHDADNDGVPDWQESLCDPGTDAHCTGLCFNNLDNAQCTSSGNSFTIKFTDCQVNVTTTLNPNATTTTQTFMYTSLVTTTALLGYTGGVTSATVPTAIGDAGIWCTDSTTNGTVAKILAGWNPTANTVNGVSHDHIDTTNFFTPQLAPCAYWNPTSAILSTTPTFTQDVQCAGAIWFDLVHLTTTTTTPLTVHFPYDPTSTAYGAIIGSVAAPLHVFLNGSITLANGRGGVDEQLLTRRYNNLTQVWTDNLAPDTDLDPFVTLNGASFEYRVIDPDSGFPIEGTTWQLFSHNKSWDGMDVDLLTAIVDMDGTAGAVFATGQAARRMGDDFEDGWFIFSAGDAIVSMVNKNGWFGGREVGVNATTGAVILNLSFYENKGETPGSALNGENDQCGRPRNAPCQVTIEVNIKTRTYTATAVSGCQSLGAADLTKLVDVSF